MVKIQDFIGMPRAAQALFLCGRLNGSSENTRALIWVLPNENLFATSTENLEAGFEHLADLSGQTRLNFKILEFPTWTLPPASWPSHPIRIRQQRLAVLSSLAAAAVGDGPVLVVLTTLRALHQPTLPYGTFEESSVTVSSGRITLPNLLQRLVRLGYERVDTVSDPGTYAVRGDLVDLYSVDQDYPARIEFFGDDLERIRFFDPDTQITIKGALTAELTSFRIPPAKELLLLPEVKAHLRKILKFRADEATMSRRERDPVLGDLESGALPPYGESWVALASEKPGYLCDYIRALGPSRSIWAISEPLLAVEQAREWMKVAQAKDGLNALIPKASEIYGEFESTQSHGLEDLSIRFESTESGEVRATDHASVPTVRSLFDLAFDGAQQPQVLAELQAEKASLERTLKVVDSWANKNYQVRLLAGSAENKRRLEKILSGRGQSHYRTSSGSISESIVLPAEKWVLVSPRDLFGTSKTPSGKSKSTTWAGLQVLSDLQLQDLVVHRDHGIGRYMGLSRLTIDGAESDYLTIEYDQKDRLFLPAYRLNLIQKYSGGSEQAPLDRLGTPQFIKTKERVKNALKTLAIDLLALYAQRSSIEGPRYAGRDDLFREFEAKFPYQETPDQLKAVDDVLGDLQSGRITERLICGDVGYGKTEVAIRAAFRVATEGRQVAVLVPTTILALQHTQSFMQRLAGYPLVIESLSRFRSAKAQQETLQRLETGKADIVIGTHRLLSKDVQFKDLGLLIIDEEHRFGVEHKEKLKTIRTNVPTLAMTATPIPRTLQMSLSGLREISLIQTPPMERLPIKTYLALDEDDIIARAIKTELDRGGQVFFVTPRVQGMELLAERISKLVPEVRIGMGHGQMAAGVLEKAMVDFYEGRTQVLLCTTIVESGLDVPNANTILVHNAHFFGLAQLYQLRGRVGRAQERAYAYFLVPGINLLSSDAKQRLEIIQKFVDLGSGFKIASHDLEMRGGGDILGADQSGHLDSVGLDLYLELLQEAIEEAKNKGPITPKAPEPEIQSKFASFLPDDYTSDVQHRVVLYRRLASCESEAEVSTLRDELIDRFGPLPPPAENLVWTVRIKIVLKKFGVQKLSIGPDRISITAGPNSSLNPTRVISLAVGKPNEVQLTPDSRVIVKIATSSLETLEPALETLLAGLSC